MRLLLGFCFKTETNPNQNYGNQFRIKSYESTNTSLELVDICVWKKIQFQILYLRWRLFNELHFLIDFLDKIYSQKKIFRMCVGDPCEKFRVDWIFVSLLDHLLLHSQLKRALLYCIENWSEEKWYFRSA